MVAWVSVGTSGTPVSPPSSWQEVDPSMTVENRTSQTQLEANSRLDRDLQLANRRCSEVRFLATVPVVWVLYNWLPQAKPDAGGMKLKQVPDRQTVYFVFCIVYILFSQWEFLPWKIRVALFPKESQLQQSRATQP